MKESANHLNRRSYLKTAGAATAGMVGLAGCAGGNDGTGGDGGDGGTDGSDGGDEQSYGILSTSITDQPNDIGDFEQLTVTLDGIWLKPAGDDDETESEGDAETPEDGTETESQDDAETTDSKSTESGDDAETTESKNATEEAETEDEADDEDGDGGSGRYYIEFEEPQQADLVQLQGAETALVDETEVEARQYQFLQLDVSDATGILAESGEEAAVETPGNAPLKFNTSFEIRAEERTRFIADFAPHRTGQGKYVVRPVATGTKVLYGDEEYEPDEDAESTDDSDGDRSGDRAGDGDGGDGDTDDGTGTAGSATGTPSGN